jgi:predicted phage terminase large subunit-like protein
MERVILDAIMDPNDRFVAVNAPPQCGKTSYSGELLPFWLLGMFPQKRIILITYSDDYSITKGRAVRALVDQFGMELFGIRIDRTASSAADWQIDGSRGGLLSVGIGSQITGRPGDIIIIDDVIKNMQEAGSAAVKNLHEREYDGTISTRLQPGGTIIITATRFAEDDLTGRLKARQETPGYEGDRFEFLEYQAICEPPDSYDGDPADYRDRLGRKPGEPLKCRFDRPGEAPEDHHFYRVRRRGMDPFTFSCLYQQRPTMPEGGMFPPSKWRFYNEPPVFVEKVRVWDLAASEDSGDWTVGLLAGAAENGDIYAIDVLRFRRNAGDVEHAVMEAAKSDGYGVKILIEQERAGSGKALVSAYQRRLRGWIVEPAKAEGSKEVRARPYSAMVQSGRWWLPSGAAWVDEWIDEHKKMMGDGRRPRHDDQIDVGAYATLALLGVEASEAFDPYGMNLSGEAQMFSLLEQAQSSQPVAWGAWAP